MIRNLFYLSIVRFFCHFIIGREVSGREKLPKEGPAILIANHNSHLDALMVLSLYSRKQLENVYAVGAKDYFFRNRFLAFFSKNLIGVIPIDRKHKNQDILEPIYQALEKKEILLIFPEGTRNTEGTLSNFKNGISKIAQQYPEIPFYPIVLSGMRRVYGKKQKLLVPFLTKIKIKDAEYYQGDRHEFMERVYQIFQRELEGEKNL